MDSQQNNYDNYNQQGNQIINPSNQFNNNQYQQNNGYNGYQQQSYPQPNGSDMDYTPISMWGYFGYEILFSIPCIGFILLIVFSFGGTKNINLRNFARSYFCFMIIAFVLGFILYSIILGSAVSSYM